MRLLEQNKVSTTSTIRNLIKSNLNEADEYSFSSGSIETNTGELGIFDASQYNGIDEYASDYEITREEVDDICMEVGKEILQEEISNVLPSAKVSTTSMYHPKEYNFSGDEIEFRIDFNPKEMQNLINTITSREDFEKQLHKYFKSYSGFMSFYADNIDDFNTQDVRKQVISVLTIAINEHSDYDELSNKYMETVIDKIGSNHSYTEEYEKENGLDESVKEQIFDKEEVLREILNCMEVYQEACDEDYDDCFRGTVDSYANEQLESNLTDIILYDMNVDIHDEKKFDKYYDTLYDLIADNNVDGIKKFLGITEGIKESTDIVDDAKGVLGIEQGSDEEEQLNSLSDREIDYYVCKECRSHIKNINDFKKKHLPTKNLYKCPKCGEVYTFDELNNMIVYKED